MSVLQTQCDACKKIGGDEIVLDPLLHIYICPECLAIQATHSDFSNPYFVPTPQPKGIPFDKFFTPQKMASLLCKVSFKSKFKPNGKATVRGGKGKPTGKPVPVIKK